VVKLDVILTAHHMGHFSYKACAINAGEVASQECFDRNPLTFVEDVLYGSRPDPNYPNRAYIPRADARFIQKDSHGYKFSHRFRLPQGLSGDLVLLQWHYITGNACLPDNGYLTYNFPEGFRPNLQLGVCSSIPPNGRGIPDQVSRIDQYIYVLVILISVLLTFLLDIIYSRISIGIVLKSELRVIVQATLLLLLPLLPILVVVVVVAARPVQAQAHVATAIAETVSVQMERAAPNMAGAEPPPNTAAVVVAVAAARPVQAQAHVATAIAETASAQMERAAPNMAGAEPPPNIAAAGCCVGTMATQQKQRLRGLGLSLSLRRRWKCLMT